MSNCSGECAICSCGENCLAGNGDDDYSDATKEQVIKRLDNDRYPRYRQLMIDFLRQRYGVIYPPPVLCGRKLQS